MAKLPLPDEQPNTVNALRNMRSKIAGEIEMHSREIDRLRAELVHLDATMQLFDPETDPSGVPALRRYPRRTEWFARGEVMQRIYEAFREQEVIWPRQIAKRAMAEKAISETDKKIARDIITLRECCLRSDPARQAGQDRSRGRRALETRTERTGFALSRYPAPLP